MPTDSAYAQAFINVATQLNNVPDPSGANFKVELKNLEPAENDFLTDWAKKYSDDITQIRGSVTAKVQMGEAFPRTPGDIDPTFADTETMQKAVQEAESGLNKIAGYRKFSIDPEDKGLLT